MSERKLGDGKMDRLIDFQPPMVGGYLAWLDGISLSIQTGNPDSKTAKMVVLHFSATTRRTETAPEW